MSNRPQPLLRTPADQFSANERIKLEHGLNGAFAREAGDADKSDLTEAAEAVAKSHGIYLEYDRDKGGKEKDFMYMVRLTLPGGGALRPDQWAVLDEAARKFTRDETGGIRASVRLTTRQNVQFHWVRKADLVPMVRHLASSGFFAINGCGDNTRNVMACPLSRWSTLFNGHATAGRLADHFQLPLEAHIKIFGIDPNQPRALPDVKPFEYVPNLLNRKFKIGLSQVHRDAKTGAVSADNCVELRTNDLAAAPVLKDGAVVAFQLYIGGGQGEKNGKPSLAALGLPLGQVAPDALEGAMSAVVAVHQEWGDRKNRHWARLKYVLFAQGMPWWQEQVRARGVALDAPDESFDPGPRRLHQGWHAQESNGKLARGVFVENGRLIDRPGVSLLTKVNELIQKFDATAVVTPNQDLVLADLDPAAKKDVDAFLGEAGIGRSISVLRSRSGACVGLPTCRLSYTDSERFEPELLTELESRGYGDLKESIGITGCERQCFRPATKTIGWIGQGPDLYQLKLGGSEDGRFQGVPLVNAEGKWVLRQVPRARVADVCSALFDGWIRSGEKNDLGAWVRQVGQGGVLDLLAADKRTSDLLAKTAPLPYSPANDPDPHPFTASFAHAHR